VYFCNGTGIGYATMISAAVYVLFTLVYTSIFSPVCQQERELQEKAKARQREEELKRMSDPQPPQPTYTFSTGVAWYSPLMLPPAELQQVAAGRGPECVCNGGCGFGCSKQWYFIRRG
jgi:heme exporter protein D